MAGSIITSVFSHFLIEDVGYETARHELVLQKLTFKDVSPVKRRNEGNVTSRTNKTKLLSSDYQKDLKGMLSIDELLENVMAGGEPQEDLPLDSEQQEDFPFDSSVCFLLLLCLHMNVK